MSQLVFSHVSYTYDSQSSPTIDDLSVAFASGWTGVVGPNGVGKSTLLSLATGSLSPGGGSITGPSAGLYCEQRTDTPPDDLGEMLSFPDADAGRLVSILGMDADWPYRWDTLSHGERKRAQIGVALWRQPDLLALDEPTNHLDRESISLLASALERYSGIGLLVSHDRDLLDRLCGNCLFLHPLRPPAMRPGGVSRGLEEQSREDLERARDYESAASALHRVEREQIQRREKASIQNKKRSKRGLRWKDSDAREKIDRARFSGADGQAGRLLSQLDGRAAQARDKVASVDRPIQERTGVTVHGVRSARDALLRRAAGTFDLPDGRAVSHPDLIVSGSDRIAVQGPNGAGKTTLVGLLLREAPAPEDRILVIPQELSAEEGARLHASVRGLPDATLGRVISTVSRLGSDPQAVLDTERPSPGEARKLLLALGLERDPELIVMDEPTNHMDLASIQSLEVALGEFAAAMLLVSHDERFLSALARVSWNIESGRLYVNEIVPG